MSVSSFSYFLLEIVVVGSHFDTSSSSTPSFLAQNPWCYRCKTSVQGEEVERQKVCKKKRAHFCILYIDGTRQQKGQHTVTRDIGEREINKNIKMRSREKKRR
ncbi:hypothetical protein B9Z55_018849 [Caenorhabditis nigoni]|uniref:Secreted protein n=1 Tax=Caenorhabditis nigoni TaxID=1611254 RepID=A0A2G5TFX5_9PELO|nr:hypothetical protein B9Z55_018849 [Caenorhabditis nigoni]